MYVDKQGIVIYKLQNVHNITLTNISASDVILKKLRNIGVTKNMNCVLDIKL